MFIQTINHQVDTPIMRWLDWTPYKDTKRVDLSVRDLHYANNMWVACTSKGLYHDDGRSAWQECNGGSSYSTTVYYGNGVWVAGTDDGSFGYLYYSTDGINWNRGSGDNSFEGVGCVRYNNGIWVSSYRTNEEYLLYSTDGKNWLESNLDIKSDLISYNNGLWVVFGNTWNNKAAAYSSDGKKWTTIDTIYGSPRSVVYAKSIWVLTTNNGFFYSSDGKTWNQSNNKFPSNAIYYANGLFVASGSSNDNTSTMFYSTDGRDWKTGNYITGGVNSIYYHNGIWIAGGDEGIHCSIDGKSWSYSNTGEIYGTINCRNGIQFHEDHLVVGTSRGIFRLFG